MGYDFALDDETFTVHPIHDRSPATLSIEGQAFQATLSSGLGIGEYFLEIAGRREHVFVASRGDLHFIHWRGRAHRVEAINALDRARRAAKPTGGAEILRAPMPGTVIEVAALAGQAVEAGALLLTIESMKLETAITAPHAARVAEIYVPAGAQFDQGTPLVRLEAQEEDSTDPTGPSKGEESS
ncbi:MAG: hypothetical protein GY910_21325 [bacterium]|nr:hypothetical protein [Deltaproteobacteria bacterium]MCP4907522.1 hypothetical protein [bacterium]